MRALTRQECGRASLRRNRLEPRTADSGQFRRPPDVLVYYLFGAVAATSPERADGAEVHPGGESVSGNSAGKLGL
jgi:hypothetical protein